MLESKLKEILSLIARILFLGILLFIASCSTHLVTDIDTTKVFHDDLFPDYTDVAIESSDDVFSINKTVKDFVHSKLNRRDDSNKQINDLSKAIFDRTSLNLLYKDDANTTANDTFNNGAANCLSLTIMSYAMAKFANLGVEFQQVDTPDIWTRKEKTTVLNRHVNLKLFQKKDIDVRVFLRNSFQLDFDTQVSSLHMPAKKISKTKVLALFYNNKGAEALIDGHYNISYAYFRKALLTAPYLVEALGNLGVLYHRSGNIDYAENAYDMALLIKRNDTSTLENLAYIYSITDRKQQSDKILARVEKQRKNNPYYHFHKGEIESENKNWKEAKKYYKKAISLNKKQHHFYFALAKVIFTRVMLGLAKNIWALAKKFTPTEKQQLLYQGKLNLLSEM